MALSAECRGSERPAGREWGRRRAPRAVCRSTSGGQNRLPRAVHWRFEGGYRPALHGVPRRGVRAYDRTRETGRLNPFCERQMKESIHPTIERVLIRLPPSDGQILRYRLGKLGRTIRQLTVNLGLGVELTKWVAKSCTDPKGLASNLARMKCY